MIQRIRIQNFRSLVDVTVELDELTVLIGHSGTGKSNFIRAIRLLRDCLDRRTTNLQEFGGPAVVLHPRYRERPVTFDVEFTVRRPQHRFKYRLSIHPYGEIAEELLDVDESTIYHTKGLEWVVRPSGHIPPPPREIQLGNVVGFDLSRIAYVALRSGLGCYDFSGDVLQGGGKDGDPADNGLRDDASNYLLVVERIVSDLDDLPRWQRVSRSVRAVNRAVTGLTLDLPAVLRIDAGIAVNGSVIPLDVRQESEGFRRFLAHLLALFQVPPKPTLLFEHPEAGLHPGALQALFEEFHACPRDGRGQVILTTHSPQFLDHFDTNVIRVVDLKNQETQIGRLAPEQAEAAKEGFLQPGELLTVDPARLPGQLAEVPG